MDFLLYYQKVISVRGTYFVTIFLSEKTKHTGKCKTFGDNMFETEFRRCPTRNVLFHIFTCFVTEGAPKKNAA